MKNITVIYEEEWWSNCCDAPPLHELDGWLGYCMSCRKGAKFYKLNKED